MDRLATVDVAEVAGDFLDEIEVLADHRSDLADRETCVGRAIRAAICRVTPAAHQFRDADTR
ncbi:hypothetical protein [Rhizobium sp. BK376]|uniref:hypothetical protein n=1 Tax=Rhizobium sp. BK376 TaxID=2512149 RepID=UPI001FE18BF7|nr:hypothetical protein [Rhizobium sp. BK376]